MPVRFQSKVSRKEIRGLFGSSVASHKREQSVGAEGVSNDRLVLIASEEWLSGQGPLVGYWLREDKIVGQWSSESAVSREEAVVARLILPAEVVTSTNVHIPRNYLPKHRSALPYLLDDILLGEPSSQHIAVGGEAEAGDGQTPVAVMSKALLSDVVSRVTAFGVRLEAVFSDVDLLEGRSAILVAGGRWVARMEAGKIAASSEDDLWLDVGAGLSGERVTVMSGQSIDIHTQSFPFDNVNLVHLRGDWQEYLAERAVSASGVINLLQHEFLPDSDNASGRLWSMGALLLCAAMFAASLYFWGMSLVLNNASERVASESKASVSDVLPELPRGKGLKRQLEQWIELNASAHVADVGFAVFMTNFYRSWKEANLSASQLMGLRFSRAGNSAQVDVDGISVEEIDRFQGALQKVGMKSTVISVSASKQLPKGSLLKLNIMLGDG